MVVLFCFAATHVSIVISPSIAYAGRWLGMALSLLLGHVWQKKNKYRLSLKQAGVDVLIWLLLIAYSLSALDSVVKEKSLLYLVVCALQIVIFTFMSRRLSFESWRLLYGFILALCVGVSFMGLVGYIDNPEKYIVQGRLAGLGNANSVGLVAMIGVIISLAKFSFSGAQDMPTQKHRKLFYFLGGVVCLISLVLTGSRSSLGGMLAGVPVILFFVRRTSRLIWGSLALIPVMPLLTLLIEETEMKQRVALAYMRADQSEFFYTRRYVWDLAYQYFMENPWLGKGYAVHDETGMIIDGSGYIGLLASAGIIATMLFFSIAFWILVRLFRRGNMHMNQKEYLSGNRELFALGGGCFVALLVQGVGEPWMLGPGSVMHVVYWLSAGACIAGILLPQVPRSVTGGRRTGDGRRRMEVRDRRSEVVGRRE